MAVRGKKDVGGDASPLMPGARVREDGWTAARVVKFLAVLADTGCVSDAARVAGISRNSVRRARERYAPFDKACRGALASALRGLEAVAYQRAVTGRETVIIRKGQEVERRIAPSDALLKLLIQRGDLVGDGADAVAAGRGQVPVDSRGRPLTADDYITREEDAEGWRFYKGVKYWEGTNPREQLCAKLAEIDRNEGKGEWHEGHCRRCHQPLTQAVWDEILRRGGGRDPHHAYPPELIRGL